MGTSVVVALVDTPYHHEIARIMLDWSRNQLIRKFTLQWVANESQFERVYRGEACATQLAHELELGDEVLWVALAAWDPEPTDVVELVEKTIHARKDVLPVLAADQEDVREPIVILVPPEANSVVSSDSMREGWRVFVVSPEEREAVAGPNHLPEDPSLGPAHAAASLASLANLWIGNDESATPIVRSDAQVANGRFARTVASYTRIVDIGFLVDHVARDVLADRSSWPNPDAGAFDSLDRDEKLLADLIGRYLIEYHEVFGPTTIESFVLPEDPPLGLLEAWVRFLRELWDTIRLKPFMIMEDFFRTAFNRASALTEKITGYKVLRWDDPEVPILEMQATVEQRYRSADGGVAEAWSDLRRLCIGMVDGSPIPSFVPEERVSVGGRRILVLSPSGYGPDPRGKPPVPGIAACDPRKLNSLVATSGGDSPDLISQEANPDLEAYVKRHRHTLLWRLGEAISRNITATEADVADADQETQRLRDLIAEEEENTKVRAKKLLRSAKRFLLLSTILGLLVVIGTTLVALNQDLSTTLMTAGGLLALCLLLVLLFAIRLVRLRRRLVGATTENITKLAEQAIRAGVRRGDLERLQRRYAEYVEWAEILGQLLYEPWSSPEVAKTYKGVDYDVALPPSVQRAVGEVEPMTLVKLSAAGRAAVFTPRWLDAIASQQQKAAMLNYLAIRANTPDPEAVGAVIPDPYSDTHVGDGTPRTFFRIGVSDDDRKRRLGEQALTLIENELREHWSVGRIVSTARLGVSGNKLTAPSPGWVTEPAELSMLAEQAQPWVVQIRRRGLGGSGVLIGPGRVLTNAHVVNYQTGEVEVYLSGNWNPITGVVERVSQTTDLAIVILPDSSDVPQNAGASLAECRPTQGSMVFTLGYPLLLDGDPTLAWGYVSAANRSISLVRGDGRSWDLDVIQCSYASAGGASGSGVFDESGNLIGVHCAGAIRDERADDYMSFVVPIEAIRDFLEEDNQGAGSDMDPANAVALSGVSSVGLGEIATLSDFLQPLMIDLGSTVFGHDGPWREGQNDREASVVTGTSDLDVASAKLDARRGVYTVFVRSVTVMSDLSDVSQLR